MNHRSLTAEQEMEAALWYQDYERVGTFSAKARELGVTRDTLRDAIRRQRGELTTPTRRKLKGAEVDHLAAEILAGNMFHMERIQTDEQQFDETEPA